MKETFSFHQFVEYVRDHIHDSLPEPERNRAVMIRPFQKIGASYLSMSLEAGPLTAAPMVNLDDFYRQYQQNASLETLLDQMADILVTEPPDLNLDAVVKDYSSIRNRLFIRVCNAEWNAELLRTVPHIERAGLAITSHLLFSKPDQEQLMSGLITNDLLESYGVTAKELFSDAMENGRRLFPESIEALDYPPFDQGVMRSSYVVTNQHGINGAAALFYPGVLEQLGRRFPGGFYLIPTSIHEFLLQFEQTGVSLEQMENGLVETNRLITDSMDRLSDDVYYYDPAGEGFERAGSVRRSFVS